MEIFNIEFKGKRLRAYMQDDSTLYLDLCDLARCLGMSVKKLKRNISTEFIEVDEDHVSVVEDVVLFVFSPFEENYRRDLFMEIHPKIRLELANWMYENGLGDKSAHTPAFAELSANFERMKNKVEEERRFNAALLDQVVKLAKRVGELSKKLEAVGE